MKSIGSVVTILAWCVMGAAVLGQDAVPPCDLGRANDCYTNGMNSQQPSGCNWFLVIPPLYQCVDDSTAGCLYVEQEQWYASVTALNDTFKSDSCYPSCTNHPYRESNTLGCFDVLGFSNVVQRISQDSTIGPSSSDCATLNVITNCILNATAGCTGLTDYAYDRINSTQGGMAAYARCSLSVFQPSTTAAPLQIYKSLPPPTGEPPASTTNKSKLDAGSVVGIFLGVILLLMILLIIALLIYYCVRKSRQSKSRSILRDWRPNGQHVYRDEPQWIRQETIDFRGANAGGRVYKPSQLQRSVEDQREAREVREVYVNRGLVQYQ